MPPIDEKRIKEEREDLLNRVLTQERTLSHSLQCFIEGAQTQGINEVTRVRDNLRALATVLGYKGRF